MLEEELQTARMALLEASHELLPAYLVFGIGGVRELLIKLLVPLSTDDSGSRRNARAGDRERHLLLYLQRICAKSDTFSRFGPSAWGAVTFRARIPNSGSEFSISSRDCFLERWTANAVAVALNSDAATRAELAPRLNPNGRIDENEFVLANKNQRIPLDQRTIELLQLCDGQTPAYHWPEAMQQLEDLAHLDVIRWEVESPALDPHAFESIVSSVEQWREGPARTRWLGALHPLARLPKKFAETQDVASRVDLMNDARERLATIGVETRTPGRHLYSAANSIAEECFRNCEVSITEEMADQFASGAQPWIDFWRDSYAFVASRVSVGLIRLLDSAPREGAVISLPAFLQHCASHNMPLTGYGTVALAQLAFLEVKEAFLKQISDRSDVTEIDLTLADCRVVREKFDYPKFDEYTYPSADLQLSARSALAVESGDFQWVLAEFHPPPAMLHHCFYWSCPDKVRLSKFLAQTVGQRPSFHFGFAAADFTAHTTVHLFDALPELTNFVAPQRGNEKWRTVRPGDAEVFVDEETGDVGVRTIDSHEYLGSFARNWIIPLGFHPFHFGLAPHTPRLRCGNVIVQRRAWTVTMEELRPGDFTGISRDLVLAIEQLRVEKDWPRHVYIRPTERALRRSGAEGRDKDTKPVYIDLESYLSLEIFHRWLKKAGELEVTEMLPDPEHLCWQEADGRRTFELRTLIVPR